MSGSSTLDVRPASERFPTNIGWLDSKHSFSFGQHYDPANVGHGQLIVLNDDRVAPGGGFTPHSHRDMEIVTWVLEGKLEHRDSEGNHGVLYPGLAQRMSAGTGITHSEMNGSQTEPVHFIQMWVLPDTEGIAPEYEERDLNAGLDQGGLVAVASGRGHDGAITINQKDAVMWVGRLDENETIDLPSAPHVHVFIARGAVEVEGHQLGTGDALRLSGADEHVLTSAAASEVIIWETA